MCVPPWATPSRSRSRSTASIRSKPPSTAGADIILLDNLRGDDLRRAVEIVGGEAVTEASGNVTLETAADVAASGVDVISLGWITHCAPRLDVALDF